MKRILIFILVAMPGIVFAQSKYIEGVVYSAVDGQPLPYANVFLPKHSLGTISNARGAFRILIPPEAEGDSLVVSFIGYRSKTYHHSEIKGPLKVFLNEETTGLDEIVITDYTASTLVQKAIERIPGNYFSGPYISEGFYRVTSQKDNNYIHLSEAVFEVYRSKEEKQDQQFRLDRMRAIKDERASRGIDLGLKPEGVMEFDIVNNPDALDFLTKKGMARHNFKIEGTELVDGRSAYKISFDQKMVKSSGYKGYMLIDKETLAFVYFNLGLSDRGMRYHKFGDASQRAMMKILGIEISMNRNQYQLQYKRVGQWYFLNNVGNDAVLNFKSDREHYNFSADTRVDYLVTKIQTKGVQAFTKDQIMAKGKLIEAQHSLYDPDYWKDHTIMLPTSDFNEIATQLEANNKANDFREEIERKVQDLPKDLMIRTDSILAYYNRKHLFNGNALVAYDDQVVLKKSYNSELTSAALNSQFRIGSVSKTFTSMLIAQLVHEGRLNFSDPIRLYLPDYPNGEVTIAQLLSHQSGIPDLIRTKDYIEPVLTETYSISELVTLYCSDPLVFEPGTAFAYSNSNFVILSAIVESIGGTDFGTALQTKIFDPLMMDHTFYGYKPGAKSVVTGYMYGKPEPEYNVLNTGGAGGITSDLDDLFIWSRSLDSGALLPPETINVLWEPRAEYVDWDAFYGFGWMIDRYLFSASKKHSVIYHPGTDFGFCSMFLKQPDKGITIILLNQTGGFPRFEIAELILNELN